MIWDCRFVAREAGTDTRRPSKNSKAEIEGDGDSQAIASVRSDLMKQPRGKEEQEAWPGPDSFGSPDRLAILSQEFQAWRIHARSRTTGIKHFELAAQTGIRGAATVSDIVGPGPEGARMIVANIPIARPVHIRPRHDIPFGLD